MYKYEYDVIYSGALGDVIAEVNMRINDEHKNTINDVSYDISKWRCLGGIISDGEMFYQSVMRLVYIKDDK